MLKDFQRNELTEYMIYSKLAKMNDENKQVLEKIAQDELRHYQVLRQFTGVDVKPKFLTVLWYLLLARILGLTFALKVMEKGENRAQQNYSAENQEVIRALVKDEDEHERMLLDLLNEEKLNYIGSMVLGLNDALVELTGALAGLTLALQKTRIVAISGIITGVAAALSMAASDYLAKKSEKGEKNPTRSALYTGVAYIFTVIFLTFPYLVFTNVMIALLTTLLNAVLVILLFTYFISVVKETDFKKDFLEMFSISMGVAATSFFIGLLIRRFLGVEL